MKWVIDNFLKQGLLTMGIPVVEGFFLLESMSCYERFKIVRIVTTLFVTIVVMYV